MLVLVLRPVQHRFGGGDVSIVGYELFDRQDVLELFKFVRGAGWSVAGLTADGAVCVGPDKAHTCLRAAVVEGGGDFAQLLHVGTKGRKRGEPELGESGLDLLIVVRTKVDFYLELVELDVVECGAVCLEHAIST